MKELYNTAEAAEYLMVHRQTIKNWIASGQLKGQKKGRIYLFTKAQLEQCQAQRRPPGRQPIAPKDGFYTTKEICNKLDCTREWVSQLAKRNKWDRIDGRFLAKIIDEFLEIRDKV